VDSEFDGLLASRKGRPRYGVQCRARLVDSVCRYPAQGSIGEIQELDAPTQTPSRFPRERHTPRQSGKPNQLGTSLSAPPGQRPIPSSARAHDSPTPARILPIRLWLPPHPAARLAARPRRLRRVLSFRCRGPSCARYLANPRISGKDELAGAQRRLLKVRRIDWKDLPARHFLPEQLNGSHIRELAAKLS
jgi:hypothetical protein